MIEDNVWLICDVCGRKEKLVPKEATGDPMWFFTTARELHLLFPEERVWEDWTGDVHFCPECSGGGRTFAELGERMYGLGVPRW